MSVMDITAFNALEDFEQFEILFDKGVLLLDRSDNSFSYVLYQVEGFYIEIRHTLDSDAISSLRTFMSTNLLQPYLETMDIDIKELF
jgi:hypothetical protein